MVDFLVFLLALWVLFVALYVLVCAFLWAADLCEKTKWFAPAILWGLVLLLVAFTFWAVEGRYL